MRAEIVAVGTELLLGQIVDTNSSAIAEQLATVGVDCHFQTRVGDNVTRIVEALSVALTRADAVIVTGGLGPTQDDVTREAIALTMGVQLVRDPKIVEVIEGYFAGRGLEMPKSNERQADVPEGAQIIPQVRGTAPGLICPLGDKVIYTMPGVPHEMLEMMERAVLPDLSTRSGLTSVIRSRTLRTWGLGESLLAERVAGRLEALDRAGPGAATIAFLASDIEGVKVRITAKAPDEALADDKLDREEAELRAILGDAVFGLNDETMEAAVGTLLLEAGWSLSVAESFTGGLIERARIVSVPGASRWFVGGVVSYQSEVKHRLLGVTPGPVVTEQAAAEMADGVRRLLGADVGIATAGVAGPEPQEGHEPGTAFVGLALPGDAPLGRALTLRGSRSRIREHGSIGALDVLRHRLLELRAAAKR